VERLQNEVAETAQNKEHAGSYGEPRLPPRAVVRRKMLDIIEQRGAFDLFNNPRGKILWSAGFGKSAKLVAVADHPDDLLGKLGIRVGEKNFEARGIGGGEFAVDVGGNAGFEIFAVVGHGVDLCSWVQRSRRAARARKRRLFTVPGGR
jgi:hypothetical protein